MYVLEGEEKREETTMCSCSAFGFFGAPYRLFFFSRAYTYWYNLYVSVFSRNEPALCVCVRAYVCASVRACVCVCRRKPPPTALAPPDCITRWQWLILKKLSALEADISSKPFQPLLMIEGKTFLQIGECMFPLHYFSDDHR